MSLKVANQATVSLVVLGLYWWLIGVILAVHWGYMAVHWGYILMMKLGNPVVDKAASSQAWKDSSGLQAGAAV